MASHRRRVISDQRGQVSGWLIKLVIWLTIGGLVVFEGGAVLLNRLQARDLATEAASAAKLAYDRQGGIHPARARAEQFVGDRGRVLEVAVPQDASELQVTLEKTARTLIIHRIGALDDVRVANVTESVPMSR